MMEVNFFDLYFSNSYSDHKFEEVDFENIDLFWCWVELSNYLCNDIKNG